MELRRYLEQQSAIIERGLRSCLPAGNSLITRAMRYSLFAGGKRLRPVLVIAAAEICGGSMRRVLPAACAVEMVHTYSLIHDDLPAMDDDDLRRGKPTSHRKFGEATAILAGDALLTEAFRALLNSTAPASALVEASVILSREAGYEGMIRGQVLDTVEAGTWRKRGKAAARRMLETIHLNKTAALLQASLKIGAVLAGGGRRQVRALDRYGRHIGLAFQITDDILDIVGDKKLLGKRGSDADNDKLTYPALYGLDGSRRIAREHVAGAKAELRIFGKHGPVLESLADYILNRIY